VSGVISSGLPIGTLDLVVLGEWPLSCPFYRVGTKKTTPVYQTLMLCSALFGPDSAQDLRGWFMRV
jgi:hypothetical protein